MMRRVWTFTILAGGALSACGPPDAGENEPGVERTVVGDTTIVRNTGTGAWGDSVRLVEELTIGALEGPEEYQFGFSPLYGSDLAVDPDGGIYVFDGQVPSIRYYDAEGTYVRTVGRAGEGPGEYGNAVVGMVVRRSDGHLVMRDPTNVRLNVYAPDGSPSASWRIESTLYIPQGTSIDERDHLYLKIWTEPFESGRPTPTGFLHLNDRGELVDTIVSPTLPGEPEENGYWFAVSKEIAMSPMGGLIVGLNSRYRVDHYRPGGTVLRIERDIEPVVPDPEERSQMDAFSAYMRELGSSTNPPPVPATKPFYRTIWVGQHGRIWLRRYVEAEPGGNRVPSSAPPLTWREPTVFDVFEPDGTFLGAVEVPDRVDLTVFRGDLAWGIRRGELDEPYVVRMRVIHE